MRQDETPNPDPMEVVRIKEVSGSHIEPEFDDRWSLLDQLRWKTGVVLFDTGLKVQIRETDKTPTTYMISCGNCGIGDRSFESAWSYLTAFSMGAEEMRKKYE